MHWVVLNANFYLHRMTSPVQIYWIEWVRLAVNVFSKEQRTHSCEKAEPVEMQHEVWSMKYDSQSARWSKGQQSNTSSKSSQNKQQATINKASKHQNLELYITDEYNHIMGGDGGKDNTAPDAGVAEPDFVMDEVLPLASQITFGAAMGLSSGYALRQVGRLAGLTLGAGFCLVQGLAYMGYVDVNWRKVERDYSRALDRDGDGKITVKDFELIFHDVADVLKFNMPAGSGFTGGLAYGLSGNLSKFCHTDRHPDIHSLSYNSSFQHYIAGQMHLHVQNRHLLDRISVSGT
jgi:uncharacterized membrane protein (Fun14 family)